MMLRLIVVLCVLHFARGDPFFFFVRQSPGGYCKAHHCNDPPEDDAFTIHGLWPNADDGSYPQFCTKQKFRRNDILDLEGELSRRWPSYSGSNEVFWTHEWEKHGTCSAPTITSQHDYFLDVLKLHSKFNIEDALYKAAIYPSQSKSYSAKDMTDAIASALGAAPVIHCESGYLTEVWMCINENLELEDCQGACPNPGCDIATHCQTVKYWPVAGLKAEDTPSGALEVATA